MYRALRCVAVMLAALMVVCTRLFQCVVVVLVVVNAEKDRKLLFPWLLKVLATCEVCPRVGTA